MASISVTGTGSGIDVSSFVTQQQLTVERPTADPSRALQVAPVQTNLSSQGKLQGAQSTYVSAAQNLAEDMSWAHTVTQSSQASAVSASSDSTATAGNYSVEVNSLATAQATTSASFSGVGTVIGLGTLHIELGGMNSSQTAFSTNPNWPKSDVRLGPHDNSLEKIRDKINAAGVGVVASVISDATGSRLVLRSTTTGADNGFKVSASGEEGKPPGPDLAALGFDPMLAQQSTVQTQAAADAKAKINGVDAQSSTNTVSDAVQGVSFKLGKVTDGPVRVSVDKDLNALKKSINEFTQSYNELKALGQPPVVPSQRLADIGIAQNNDGALKVDSARLDKALATQPEKVRDVFAEALDEVSANLAQDQPSARGSDQPAASYAQKLLVQYKSLEPSETAAH
ncbi:flagellar filament capping protein FliD [Aquabacterium sp.]|uniref:flagellar filament capping protein FliD n=1 Tax=Aquabacterium sp. TaxID=1872578 RepID=UPI0019A98E83|nr:flagellar filament capping protein FliD [Aquabacterium sp.]MBC7699406.1 flagellar filament capping protein FliD [Aquabacterium sp.]